MLGNGRGRSPRRQERWQSAPQVEMKQDLFDHLPLINHRKQSHPVLAMRANQRVGVPDFENDIPPFSGRQLRRRWRRARRAQRIRRNTTVFEAMLLTTHFFRVPTVVTDHLRALLRNVLSDRCQKVRSRKNLEVAVDLRIPFGAVDDLLASGVERHFGNRKRVAQNVLGEWFEDGLVLGRNAFSAMYVEAAVFPRMQKTDTVAREQVEVD